MTTTGRDQAPAAPLEDTVLEAFPFLLDALGIAALGLVVPKSLSLGGRFGVELVLLSVLVVFLAYRLLPRTDSTWFAGTVLAYRRRVFATGLALVIIVTGVVGLTTLAASAALRFQPSTQFLMLLSALDIAWSVTAVMVAVYWLWGRMSIALAAGGAVVALCVWAIVNYLNEVGFGPNGGWRLRADSLWTYVLPYDMFVAAVAIGLFWLAVRKRSDQRTLQASDQS